MKFSESKYLQVVPCLFVSLTFKKQLPFEMKLKSTIFSSLTSVFLCGYACKLCTNIGFHAWLNPNCIQMRKANQTQSCWKQYGKVSEPSEYLNSSDLVVFFASMECFDVCGQTQIPLSFKRNISHAYCLVLYTLSFINRKKNFF